MEQPKGLKPYFLKIPPFYVYPCFRSDIVLTSYSIGIWFR